MFSSVQELSEGLREAGYIADPVAITTVFLAAALHRPVFCEGPAGSGKTQLAYAVAEAAKTSVERLQCYQGIDEDKAIGKFDESLQRLCVELKSKSASVDWELVKNELHGEQFFMAGPLLRALQNEKACVLLIDELDKVDHAFEAQAFKRSCACFGLGRYLYYFEGMWVDLDDRKRPKSVPQLPQWATPHGWRKGFRPQPAFCRETSNHASGQGCPVDHEKNHVLARQIEAMAEPLGKAIYRGLLRTIARAWKPAQIQETELLERVLRHMQAAERGLGRLDTALSVTGPKALGTVLQSLRLASIDQVDNLETLKMIVLEMEKVATKQTS